MRLERDRLLGAYEQLLTIRGFETRAEQLFLGSQIRGSVHLGIGQEAVAVGARMALEEGDAVVPTYRGHAYALAWGLPLEAAFGELLGRETGCNRGRGGSKHFSDAARNVLPGNAIVAAGIPIACGVALQAHLDGLARVVIAPFGDGATNQGAFHEALNLAAVWDLPVVFLCENNLYSEMTPISRMVRVDRLADRAGAYGIRSAVVDGMDLDAVVDAVGEAAGRARAGEGPTFLEMLTYRFCGHMPGDAETYRTKEEVESWRARDPLTLTRQALRERGVVENKLAELETRVETELDAAQAAAAAAPEPDPAAIGLGAAEWMETER